NESSEPNVFIINDVTADDAGSYRYTVSNSWATDLVAQISPIAVQVIDIQGPAFTGARYNGIISSVTWRTDKAYGVEGEDLEGTYLFDYDDKYQIEDATFADPVFGPIPGYNVQGNKFRLTGMSYDPNGN